jgi:hypothetical protein
MNRTAITLLTSAILFLFSAKDMRKRNAENRIPHEDCGCAEE